MGRTSRFDCFCGGALLALAAVWLLRGEYVLATVAALDAAIMLL